MTLAAGKIDLPSWKEFTTIDLVLQLLVVLEVSSSLTSVIDPGCTVTVLELLFFPSIVFLFCCTFSHFVFVPLANLTPDLNGLFVFCSDAKAFVVFAIGP